MTPETAAVMRALEERDELRVMRTHAKVMRILMDENGHQYDLDVLDCFLRIIESSRYRPPD